jgi:hypothetical protein
MYFISLPKVSLEGGMGSTETVSDKDSEPQWCVHAKEIWEEQNFSSSLLG